MSILSRVQSNPEIGNSNSPYVTDLVNRAKNFICSYCNLPLFPEQAKGFTRSATDAATDLSMLDSNTLLVSVNGSPFVQVSLSLDDCDSGESTAAELQDVINEVSSTFGFDEVTVSFDEDTGQYTLTSGRYGTDSSVRVTFDENTKAVCRALSLSPLYGAVEKPGAFDNEALIDAAVMLVEMKYRQLGLEGLQSGSIPGGVSFSAHDLDPTIQAILHAHRRI